MSSILIVDDEKTVRENLRRYFSRGDLEVHVASSGASALKECEAHPMDVVLLDLRLPDMDGIEVLRRMKEDSLPPSVIMITGHGEMEPAIQAIRAGAEHFLPKPVDLPSLGAAVSHALERRRNRQRIQFLNERLSRLKGAGGETYPRIPSELEPAVALLARNAGTSVLIQGETGTGKSVIARLIHQLSSRSSCQFVDISCAGLSAALLESELFGHEKGAFTDAKHFKQGLLEVAHGGTLFLDDVGEMEPTVQAKLLKVLEEKRFRRLGATRSIEVDVRVMAATNEDLSEAVQRGRFRSDLFYRLKVMPVHLPPLRERREDILPLANRFLGEFFRGVSPSPPSLSEKAREHLVSYAWPGNIRELRNVMERASILSGGVSIQPDHLPQDIRRKSRHQPLPAGEDFTLRTAEARHIADVLERCGHNRTHAARRLGIHRSTLIQKIKTYGL